MAHVDFSCLVEESLGKQWYFTLTDQQIIEYSWKDGSGWTQPAQVDGQTVRQFSVTIDRNDKVCLLAYNNLKQLIYYEWNGQQWYHRLLYRVQSRFENISYLEILSTGDKIHIFYYIENALKRAQESLIHSYLEGEKWQSTVLMHFLTDQEVMLRLIQNDALGNLFGIYTRVVRNETRCYFIYYDNFHGSWSKPFTLFQQPGTCSGFDGHSDSSGSFHMVWVEKGGSEYRLNYRRINPAAPNVDTETVRILDETQQLHHPCVQAGNDLHCFWIQDGKGLVSRGSSLGKNWDLPQELYKGSVKAYRKVTKTLDGNAHFSLELGDGYPVFGWTLKTLLSGEKPKYHEIEKSNPSNQIGLQKESRPVVMLNYSSSAERKDQTLLDSIDQVQARMDGFQREIDEMKDRLENFQDALYQLQDYIRQKDKSSFQKEAQIRKLAFELEQLQTLRTSAPAICSERDEDLQEKKLISIEQPVPPDEQKNMQTELPDKSDVLKEQLDQYKAPLKNIDLGSGEIQLGNVSIIINPDDEESSEND